MSLCRCGCKGEVPEGQWFLPEHAKLSRLKPKRTLDEKLAIYWAEKNAKAERARVRRQKTADHAHYLAAKKRKAKREREALRLEREAKRIAAALKKAKNQERIRRLAEEKSFKKLSQFNKIWVTAFADGRRVGFEEGKATQQPALQRPQSLNAVPNPAPLPDVYTDASEPR